MRYYYCLKKKGNIVRIADWEDAISVAINHLRSITLYVDYLSQHTL